MEEKTTFEEALQSVQINGYLLALLNPELQNNFDIVLAAVKKDGGALKYASERLKDDPEIVLAAVKQNRWAYDYISDAKLKDDISRVLTLASTEEIKNLQEKLTGKLQVLTVEQAMEFIQEL